MARTGASPEAKWNKIEGGTKPYERMTLERAVLHIAAVSGEFPGVITALNLLSSIEF